MDMKLFRETLFAGTGLALIIIGLIIRATIEAPMVSALVFGSAFIIAGFYKAKEGVQNTIADRHLNVEILMILAALAAFIIENYMEAAVLIIIFSISGVLESFANKKSEKELKSLLNLAPEQAVKYDDGKERVVPLSDVNVGDVLIVKVGEKVPVDSTVLRGQSGIDQSAITGEFVPAPKGVGDTVYAGAINLEGTLIIKATKNPANSVIQKIVKFVKDAQADQPTQATKIETFERYYVYVVILMAILFMVIPPQLGWLSQSDALYRGIIVLVVGSPCALVASIAPAVLSGLSNASRQHILIKGGSIMETLTSVDRVFFDKTGTITTGKPRVHALHVSGISEQRAKRVLVTLESQSTHPMARAIVNAYDVAPYKDVFTKEMPGTGMTGTIETSEFKVGRFDGAFEGDLKTIYEREQREGKSSVKLIENDKVVGVVILTDTIREDARATMDALKARGITPIMMSGDTVESARPIGEAVGIDIIEGGCMPDDKVTLINQARNEGHSVLVIGDGINDAPALQKADVAIAMGTGTDISLETSDIVFIDDKLSSLTYVMDLAIRQQRIITTNVIFSVSVIVLLLLSNAVGMMTLPIGVLAHELSTILVILNSLRLLIK